MKREITINTTTESVELYTVIEDRFGRYVWVPWSDRSRLDVGVPVLSGILAVNVGVGACALVTCRTTVELTDPADKRRADGSTYE